MSIVSCILDSSKLYACIMIIYFFHWHCFYEENNSMSSNHHIASSVMVFSATNKRIQTVYPVTQ